MDTYKDLIVPVTLAAWLLSVLNLSSLTIAPYEMQYIARSHVEQLDPSEALLWVSENFIDECFELAITIVLAYDAMITMDKEAKYFWKHPRNEVDFVYFTNRYIGILGAISRLFFEQFGANLSLCKFSGWFKNIANWIIIVSIDYILTIRVLAMYSQDRTMSIWLKALFALSSSFKLGLVVYLVIAEKLALGELPGDVSVCTLSSYPLWQLGVIDWIIPMAYGIILMILAIFKAIEYWKVSAGFKGLSLVKVILRDQALYFMLVIVLCMFSTISVVLTFSNNFVSNIFGRLGTPSLLSVLGSRMLFNLKEAGERGQNEETTNGSPQRTMSAMVFVYPKNTPRVTGTEATDDEQVSA